MSKEIPEKAPRRIPRREFARALCAAAMAGGLAGPLGAVIAPPQAPAKAPRAGQDTSASASPAAAPGTAMPAVTEVPGMTEAQREQVRKVIERDAAQRRALHTPPLAYDLEPAFVFRARRPARRRLPA